MKKLIFPLSIALIFGLSSCVNSTTETHEHSDAVEHQHEHGSDADHQHDHGANNHQEKFVVGESDSTAHSCCSHKADSTCEHHHSEEAHHENSAE